MYHWAIREVYPRDALGNSFEADLLLVVDRLRTLPAGIGMLITQAQAVMPRSA